MEILKCNADFDKVYYVEINGCLYQCKLIRTESSPIVPIYMLNVAQLGEIGIKVQRQMYFDKWYRSSEIPSILYESIEDYENGKPIIDNYGSTSNCFNTPFVKDLFKYCSVCNCGGSTYTWKWDGCKAIENIVSMKDVTWTWDVNGFHCSLNNLIDCYRTKEECINNNKILVVNF